MCICIIHSQPRSIPIEFRDCYEGQGQETLISMCIGHERGRMRVSDPDLFSNVATGRLDGQIWSLSTLVTSIERFQLQSSSVIKL